MHETLLQKLADGPCEVLVLGRLTLHARLRDALSDLGRSHAVRRIAVPERHGPTQLNDPLGLPGDIDAPDDAFDIVLSASWHEHADWFRWSLQEIRRVLKANGIAQICLSMRGKEAVAARGATTRRARILANVKRKLGREPATQAYGNIPLVLRELGLELESTDRLEINSSLMGAIVRTPDFAVDLPKLGQTHCDVFICTATALTWPSNRMLCDRDFVAMKIAADYEAEGADLRNFEKATGIVRRPAADLAGLPTNDCRALVLSPHPDDELIGVGGTMMKILENGGDVHILQMSNGRHAVTLGEVREPVRSAIRLDEARRVAAQIGAQLQAWADVPDGKSTDSDGLARRLADLLGDLQPTSVFVPFVNDPHPDHVLANRVLADALQRAPNHAPETVLSYEVWSFCPYNSVVDIAKWSDKKFALLTEYRTALRPVNYARVMQLFGTWHSFEIFGHGGQVEVFLKQTTREYLDMARSRVAAVPPTTKADSAQLDAP